MVLIVKLATWLTRILRRYVRVPSMCQPHYREGQQLGLATVAASSLICKFDADFQRVYLLSIYGVADSALEPRIQWEKIRPSL